MGRANLSSTSETTSEERDLEHLSSKKIALHNEIGSATEAKKKIETSIEEKAKEHEDLKIKIKELNDSFKELYRSKEKAESLLNDRRAEVKKETEKINQRLEEICQGSIAADQDLKDTKEKINASKKEHLLVVQDIEIVKHDLLNEYIELGEAQKVNEKLSEEYSVLTEKIETKKKRVSELDSEIEKREEKLSGSVFAEKEKKLEELNLSIADKEKSKIKFEDEFSKLLGDIKEAKQKLADVTGETSEKMKTISIADQKLTDRIGYIQRLIDDGKAKGYINDKVKL